MTFPQHLRVTGLKGEIMLVTATCPQCHKPDLLELSEAGFTAWRLGKLIQEALPELSNTQREQLITGTCQPCWDAMWAEEDDDDLNDMRAARECIADDCHNLVPWNQGSDYCETCIAADRPEDEEAKDNAPKA